jgi:hypothetical protein
MNTQSEGRNVFPHLDGLWFEAFKNLSIFHGKSVAAILRRGLNCVSRSRERAAGLLAFLSSPRSAETSPQKTQKIKGRVSGLLLLSLCCGSGICRV